jgi:hypothetical protein
VLDDSYVYCKKSDNYKDASVKRDMLMNHINSLALCSIALFLIACLYFCQLYPHFSIALFLIACLYLCQSCFVLFVTTSPLLSGWASRVYYSDNGSTAIEIALKMAFRKFSLDHGILADCETSIKKERNIQLKVCNWHTKHPGLPCLVLLTELLISSQQGNFIFVEWKLQLIFVCIS